MLDDERQAILDAWQKIIISSPEAKEASDLWLRLTSTNGHKRHLDEEWVWGTKTE